MCDRIDLCTYEIIREQPQQNTDDPFSDDLREQNILEHGPDSVSLEPRQNQVYKYDQSGGVENKCGFGVCMAQLT